MTRGEQHLATAALTRLWHLALRETEDRDTAVTDLIAALHLLTQLVPQGELALAALAAGAGPVGARLYQTLVREDTRDESARQLRLPLDTPG